MNMAEGLVSAKDRPVTIATDFAAGTAFASAATVASLDGTGVPAAIHRKATDAIQATVQPWMLPG